MTLVRRLLLLGAPTLLIGGLAVGALLGWGSSAQQPAATPALPPATATVSRTTLVETRTVPGTLGHGESVPLSSALSGTLTWLPPIGAVIEQGQPLFSVDEQPVVLFYGTLPLYRTLERGSEGNDVLQLEQALAVLGHEGFTVDERYTRATADAVSQWQADLGRPETGVVEPGQIVFNDGPLRIAEHIARVGDRINGGTPVLQHGGILRQVIFELGLAEHALAGVGRPVTVSLPGVDSVEAEIAEVSTVVTETQAGSEVRLQASLLIADQEAFGGLAAAPVEVTLVSEERADVLAVPIAALLALPEGGYGLEAVEGSSTRIVPVRTGMFAAGRVEVSGDGLAEGMQVGLAR